MAREFDCFVRKLRTEIEEKEGQEIRLIVRDYKDYIHRPVVAKIYKKWSKDLDKLYIRDPLGKPYKGEHDPWGLKILKEEEEEKLMDADFQKCGFAD